MKKIYLILFMAIIFLPITVYANTDLTIMPIFSDNWGDSALLKSGNDYLLIDVTSAENTNVIDFLKNNKVEKFSIYLSHYHYDHYGSYNKLTTNGNEMNLIEYLILNKGKGGYDEYIYDIEKVYLPDTALCDKYPSFTECKSVSTAVKEAAKATGVEVVELKTGSKFSFGTTTAEVLYMNMEIKDFNDSSLVTMFTNGNTKFLSAGDIEKTTETILVNSNIDISADIYKMNHHAISSSASKSNIKEFVNKVSPKYSYFQSTPEKTSNKYENIQTSIENLADFSNIYEVEKNGNIKFVIKNDEITPIIEKNGYRITINYIDEENNNILKTKTYDFNNKIREKEINYYLYDYEETFDNYRLTNDPIFELKTGVLSSDVTYEINYTKNNEDIVEEEEIENNNDNEENIDEEDTENDLEIENPSTGLNYIYIIIIILLLSAIVSIFVIKKYKFSNQI